MRLDHADFRVSVETEEQLSACLSVPGVELIYVDAGFFAKADLPFLVKRVHKGCGGIGKLCGLRLPKVWRKEAEAFFAERKDEIREASFDCFLAPSPEGALWLLEEGLSENGENLILDHSFYSFNPLTDEEISRLLGIDGFTVTWPLEMSSQEMKNMSRESSGKIRRELVIYGRVPMMISAQCFRRTELRCDRRMCTMKLKDRTGAYLPVKNNCTFCYNTVYNSVPTILPGAETESGEIQVDFRRMEFTTESGMEVKSILSGEMSKAFTRGHFHKGVL